VNPDFRDMLSALSDAGADYLVIGAYAMAAHGFARATGDLDIWVRPTPENAERVWNALGRFGAPTSRIRAADLHAPDVVYQIGVAPRRIDILTSVTALTFEAAWTNRLAVEIEGLAVNILGRSDLLVNKRATGRPKDLADIAWLESEKSH
jgi:hypothetical protein